MFRASSCPSLGATTTAVAASGLPSELGDSSAVGRGRADPYPPPDESTQLLIRYVTLMFHSTSSCFKWPLTVQAFRLTLYASLILTTFTGMSRAFLFFYMVRQP